MTRAPRAAKLINKPACTPANLTVPNCPAAACRRRFKTGEGRCKSKHSHHHSLRVKLLRGGAESLVRRKFATSKSNSPTFSPRSRLGFAALLRAGRGGWVAHIIHTSPFFLFLGAVAHDRGAGGHDWGCRLIGLIVRASGGGCSGSLALFRIPSGERVRRQSSMTSRAQVSSDNFLMERLLGPIIAKEATRGLWRWFLIADRQPHCRVEAIGSPRTRAPTGSQIAFPISGATTASTAGRLAVCNDCDADFRHIGPGGTPCLSLAPRCSRCVKSRPAALRVLTILPSAALGRNGSPLCRSRRGTTRANFDDRGFRPWA